MTKVKCKDSPKDHPDFVFKFQHFFFPFLSVAHIKSWAYIYDGGSLVLHFRVFCYYLMSTQLSFHNLFRPLFFYCIAMTSKSNEVLLE